MKNIKYLLLLLFLGFIPLSCLRTKLPHYEITHMRLEPYKDQKFTHGIHTNDSISSDSVFIKIILDTKYLSQNAGFNFTNSCYAFTKQRPGCLGLRNIIVKMNFFSDHVYFGRPAGEDLNDLVKVVGYNKLYESGELVTSLNDNTPSFYPETEAIQALYIDQKPGNKFKHTFTLQFIYENGKSQMATAVLQWK